MVKWYMVYGNEALGPSGPKLDPRGRASLPYTIYHFTIYHLPYTIYHLPFTIYHLPYTIYHLPFTIYHLSFAITNLLNVTPTVLLYVSITLHIIKCPQALQQSSMFNIAQIVYCARAYWLGRNTRASAGGSVLTTCGLSSGIVAKFHV